MTRYLFAIIVFIHGLIHLMGFAKALGNGNITQLTKEISKPIGMVWLATAILFTVAMIMFLMKKESWPVLAIIAVIVSQVLIITVWKEAKFGTIANVIILSISIIGYATWHYYNWFQNDVKLSLQQPAYFSNSILSETDIQSLPEPVKKYIRYTGSIGKPKVNNFRIEFEGKIRKNEQTEWMSLTSDQYNFMNIPTRLFFMKAVMKYLPVAGFHRFKNGDAFMDIRLLSLFRVAFQEGKEMDMAETVTFFNDMCCMAPATLIDKRIQWLEVEGNKVKASFTNNNITIFAWLYFNDTGELINFISNDRYDLDAGKKLPWETPMKDYKEINGYKLAGYAETIYQYPDRKLCYGIFRAVKVQYNLTSL
jgi:hypothetical protein